MWVVDNTRFMLYPRSWHSTTHFFRIGSFALFLITLPMSIVCLRVLVTLGGTACSTVRGRTLHLDHLRLPCSSRPAPSAQHLSVQ